MWNNPWRVVYKIAAEDQTKVATWVDSHYSENYDSPGMSYWIEMAERLFGKPWLYNRKTGEFKEV